MVPKSRPLEVLTLKTSMLIGASGVRIRVASYFRIPVKKPAPVAEGF